MGKIYVRGIADRIYSYMQLWSKVRVGKPVSSKGIRKGLAEVRW